MGVQENKALVQKAIDEFFNKGDVTAADRLFDNNYVWHAADGSGPMTRDRHKADFSLMKKAMPDMTIHVDDMLADGDKVVTRCTITGTHQGVLQGDAGDIHPTHKKVTWTATTTHRIQGGKIVEGWVNYDRAGIDKQLGLVARP